MNPIGHVQFIQTPISIIIQDTNSACMSLGNGIELHPLASYIMQTTFLRMTGASEQKLKCLCWEIASLDYDFRYEILQNPLGECSNYNDKKNICKSVCKSLRRYDTDIKFSDDEKNRIINQATAELLTLLKCSPLSVIFEKEYIEFESYCASSPIKRASFCNLSKEGNLNFVEEDLKKYYEDSICPLA